MLSSVRSGLNDQNYYLKEPTQSHRIKLDQGDIHPRVKNQEMGLLSFRREPGISKMLS